MQSQLQSSAKGPTRRELTVSNSDGREVEEEEKILRNAIQAEESKHERDERSAPSVKQPDRTLLTGTRSSCTIS